MDRRDRTVWLALGLVVAACADLGVACVGTGRAGLAADPTDWADPTDPTDPTDQVSGPRTAMASPAAGWGHQESGTAAPTVIVALGAEGAAEYAPQFSTWASRWEKAAGMARAKLTVIGRAAADTNADRDRLLKAIEAEVRQPAGELWVVLIGHGTWDGRTARFNLRGPDVSDADLARALSAGVRPTVIVNCASSSGPFINRLSGPNRVVITATRSGNEQNFARFGDHLSTAITDPTADYDRDGQVSLLEAFLAASRRVAEFYRTESRLATEHALIDDNGDGLGTPADWFRGLRAVKRAKDGTTHDGHRARQFVLVRSECEQKVPTALRAERDRLEIAVSELRDRRETMTEKEYYQRLEELAVRLAELQAEIDAATSADGKRQK